MRSLTDLEKGDHLCCLFETDEEHRAILVPYLRQGLERNEKVLYVSAERPAETILDYLRDDGVVVEPYLQRGQLAFTSFEGAYVPGGTFHPESVIARLASETERAIQQGYGALRVTGEGAWVKHRLPSAEPLIRYEALLNRFIPHHPCVALCQYDCRHFEPAQLLDVLRTHPHVVVGIEVCENPYFIPPDEFLNSDPAARDLLQWTRDLVSRSRRDNVLRARVRMSQLSAEHPLDDLLQVALDEAELLTGSTVGFFHLVGDDQVTITFQTWSTNTLRTSCSAQGKGEHFPLDHAGVWADALRERRPVIHNDYASLPHRRGLPSGHSPVVRELVVPVISRDRVVALLGVGNKPMDYTSLDAEMLDALANLLWDTVRQKQTERALRESEANLRGLLDATTQSILLLDRDGVVITANETACRRLAVPVEKMLGRCIFDLLPPDVAALRKVHITRALDTSQPARWRDMRDGRWLEHSVMPVKGVNDAVVGAAIYAEDVTERHRAEEALRQSESWLRAVFETAGIAMALSDTRGHCLLHNRGAEELLGYSAEEFDHINSLDITHADDLEASKKLLAALVQGSLPSYREEKRYIHKDGHAIWVDLSVTPILDPDGQVVAVIGAATDITERKLAEAERRELEQRLRQTQRMESLGILAGGIAHDFNNILMAVLGNAELALGSLSPTSPARASISRISVAARRAADLCRQMLTYSGKAPSQQEPVVVSELIEEMAHLLRASISRRVSLDLDLPSGLPPVQADASQLRQVVLNLIVNASEAIGERDGSIGLTVTASPCDDELLRKTALHDDLPPGMYVTIEVADTGCGMDEATLNRIFEPFYTTKFTGRGLGLAAVLGIIRAHQGALSVQSEPGQGTTFTIRLPALTAPSLASPPREASSQKPWRGKGTILLADDEESLLVLGVDVLETMGFTVLTACNGHEAVEIYRQRAGEIDLVVLDLTMPLMDGAAAFRELQRLNPEVRVVLASGYVEEDVSKRCEGPGLVGILQKPYTIAKLRGLLAGVMPEER